MAVKRRNRKIRNKRSNNVDSYTERYRKASDGAKAGRAAARSRREGTSEDREVIDVREGLKEFGKSISEERIQSLIVGDLAYSLHPDEETVPPAGSSDAEALGQRGVADSESKPAEVSTHWIFFEKEVNTLPVYVGKELCDCDIQDHHWHNLGEN